MAVIGVLRGGVGDEHDVSLKTGLAVLRRLENSGHRAVDIYIDRRGVWHLRGIAVPPLRALTGVDLVFNALHGLYGEDGTVQRELDRMGMRYTGPTPLAASLSMNKVVAKDMVQGHGVLVPRHTLVGVVPDIERRAVEIWQTFPQPSVVKPLNAGSSVGVTVAKSFGQLLEGITHAFQYAKDVIVEEYVKGKEATVGVIESFRGQDLYALPPVEIVLPKSCDIYDYDAKKNGTGDKRCPGAFSRADVERLEAAAKTVHDKLGLRHYSRSDFIVTPKGPYFLEANALPDLSEESSMRHSFDAVGVSMDDVLAHVLTLALEKK